MILKYRLRENTINQNIFFLLAIGWDSNHFFFIILHVCKIIRNPEIGRLQLIRNVAVLFWNIKSVDDVIKYVSKLGELLDFNN